MAVSNQNIHTHPLSVSHIKHMPPNPHLQALAHYLLTYHSYKDFSINVNSRDLDIDHISSLRAWMLLKMKTKVIVTSHAHIQLEEMKTCPIKINESN